MKKAAALSISFVMMLFAAAVIADAQQAGKRYEAPPRVETQYELFY
jgi:hypothetical protein